jgi:hypothetical protein
VAIPGTEDDGPGAIGPPDWSRIVLAESLTGGCVVTNDTGTYSVADRREMPWMRGTAFLLRTFKRRGVTKGYLSANVDAYAADLHLAGEVVDEMRAAEK